MRPPGAASMTDRVARDARCSSTASCRGWRSTSACSRRPPDPRTPLLERVKFAAIAASNLDEFFMVRVAGLHAGDLPTSDATADLAGLTPLQQLAAVARRSHAFVADAVRLATARAAAGAGRRTGIRIVPRRRRSSDRAAALARVLPRRGAAGADAAGDRRVAAVSAAVVAQPEPRAAARRRAGRAGAAARHRPGAAGLDAAGAGRRRRRRHASCCSRTIIRAHLAAAVSRPDDPRSRRSSAWRAMPSSSSTTKADARSSKLVEREVRRRRRSDVVRLEVEATASDELLALLRDQLDIDAGRRVRRARAARSARADGPDRAARASTRCAIRRCSRSTCSPARARRDLFSMLDERDVLLHHPYESYDPVVALLAQAADDPDVLAIKQTLYRTSVGSPIIASLQRAAERNKQVTVLVELTARFDEERNIHWARALEEAGAHVIYGVRGYKTHAKICLIVQADAAGPAALRPPRHRQLQRADRAHLHRLRPDDDARRRSPRTRPRSSAR